MPKCYWSFRHDTNLKGEDNIHFHVGFISPTTEKRIGSGHVVPAEEWKN
jgi:hypothetical protein